MPPRPALIPGRTRRSRCPPWWPGTPALRGFPGGPGLAPAAAPADAASAATAATRETRGLGSLSVWQRAQQAWRDAGVEWQRTAADWEPAEAEWERGQGERSGQDRGAGGQAAWSGDAARGKLLRRLSAKSPANTPGRAIRLKGRAVKSSAVKGGVASSSVVTSPPGPWHVRRRVWQAALAVIVILVLVVAGFLVFDGTGGASAGSARKAAVAQYPPARLAGARLRHRSRAAGPRHLPVGQFRGRGGQHHRGRRVHHRAVDPPGAVSGVGRWRAQLAARPRPRPRRLGALARRSAAAGSRRRRPARRQGRLAGCGRRGGLDQPGRPGLDAGPGDGDRAAAGGRPGAGAGRHRPRLPGRRGERAGRRPGQGHPGRLDVRGRAELAAVARHQPAPGRSGPRPVAPAHPGDRARRRRDRHGRDRHRARPGKAPRYLAVRRGLAQPQRRPELGGRAPARGPRHGRPDRRPGRGRAPVRGDPARPRREDGTRRGGLRVPRRWLLDPGSHDHRRKEGPPQDHRGRRQ